MRFHSLNTARLQKKVDIFQYVFEFFQDGFYQHLAESIYLIYLYILIILKSKKLTQCKRIKLSSFAILNIVRYHSELRNYAFQGMYWKVWDFHYNLLIFQFRIKSQTVFMLVCKVFLALHWLLVWFLLIYWVIFFHLVNENSFLLSRIPLIWTQYSYNCHFS